MGQYLKREWTLHLPLEEIALLLELEQYFLKKQLGIYHLTQESLGLTSKYSQLRLIGLSTTQNKPTGQDFMGAILEARISFSPILYAPGIKF